MKSTALSQFVLLLISFVSVNSFFHVTLVKNRNNVFLSMAAKTDDANVEDYNEMRNLVLSLSQVPTDEDRRARLANIFEEALARPNDQPKQFIDLFDEALTNVGNEVQIEAKKMFAAKDAEASNPEEAVDADTSENEESNDERVKSAEELQLWALVDMMVQSKTIVKKVSGKLGSKGTFQ
ncbi:unnamed protein product [Cylindrotheca closterium]|uniref:Uncharacterized protein n=1 Tax=Cylindrotheca closterium TaxID=2856 RepID=A0AAD2FCW8_9STRA|nr:unnamed protein product [Cylindrotheca closterium]